MTRRWHGLCLATAAAVLAAACQPAEDFADTAYLNARVWTGNSSQPWAEAVVVADERIVYVGNAAGAQDLIGRRTEQVDLGGRLMLPGFIDTHVHPILGGGYAKALSLDTYAQVDDWIAAIAEYARANPEKEVLFGYGFLATTFGPEGPRRELIDSIESERPVLIMDEGFHGAWANSAALERLNVTQDTPDPMPGYSYYKRDANGDATGYLLEGTAEAAMTELDVISLDVVTEGTEYVIRTMNGYGVTSAFDAGAMADADAVAAVLDELEGRGSMTLRLQGSSRPETAEEAATAVQTAARWRDTVHGEHYDYKVLKIPYDGTVEGRTAAMFEDYQGEPGNAGQTVFSEEQLLSMISGAAAIDMDVHVHALGERAVHETLNAIEASREQNPGSTTRYTICHLQVVTDQDVARFAELDVIAQSTPLWASYDEYGEQFVSPDQFQRFWRFASLAAAGARLTFGSDYPASGAGLLGLSPLVQIEIGHTRQYAGDAHAPVQPRESERLSVEQLVRGFTVDAAWQLHREQELGSIEAGKLADLVVLDRDIFEIDPYEIHSTEVFMTILGGDVVYRGKP